MSENQPRQPKKIDMTKTSFFANGKEYFVTSFLTIGRYCEFQLLEQEVGFSSTFEKVFDEINESTDLLENVQCLGDVIKPFVKLDNLRRRVAKLQEKEPPVIKLCTLFINTKDEDPAIWNNDLMTEKIEDWKAEGIDIQDFFSLAFNSQNSFIKVFKKVSAMFPEA